MSPDAARTTAPHSGPPDDWQETPLASVARIRFSSVNKVSQPSEEPVRLCNYTDVYNHDYIIADMEFMHATATLSEIEQFGIRVGDVIITKDSETPDDIGVPAVVDSTVPDLVCGYHLALIRPDPKAVDSTFLSIQLGHHRILRYFGQQANGTTRYGLSTAAIAKVPLWLPNQEEQREAGRTLRLLDEAIAKTEAVIAKLKQVRAGLLHDLLTRGVDDNGELRDPVTHPGQFTASSLGPIPREWNVMRLGDICDTCSGGTPSRARSDFWNGHIPWVKTAEINYKTIVDTEEKITTMGVLSSAARLLPVGTVIMALFGQGPTRGRVAVLGIEATVNQACLAFIAAHNLFGRFLFHLLSERYDAVRRMSNLGTQQNLNAAIVRSMPIAVPLFDEQRTIARLIDDFDAGLKHESRTLAKLRQSRSGLISDLLAGRVRVPERISPQEGS